GGWFAFGRAIGLGAGRGLGGGFVPGTRRFVRLAALGARFRRAGAVSAGRFVAFRATGRTFDKGLALGFGLFIGRGDSGLERAVFLFWRRGRGVGRIGLPAWFRRCG